MNGYIQISEKSGAFSDAAAARDEGFHPMTKAEWWFAREWREWTRRWRAKGRLARSPRRNTKGRMETPSSRERVWVASSGQ